MKLSVYVTVMSYFPAVRIGVVKTDPETATEGNLARNRVTNHAVDRATNHVTDHVTDHVISHLIDHVIPHLARMTNHVIGR